VAQEGHAAVALRRLLLDNADIAAYKYTPQFFDLKCGGAVQV